MSEIGGSTTQLGIYFQNAVAARYLGRMLDPRHHSPSEKVTDVRVEAPEPVDDVVVTFASERRLYIQVKVNVDVSGKAWKKLWDAFAKQRWMPNFKPEDRLVLFLGNADVKFILLDEACERARGADNAEEWWSRLTVAQKAFLEQRVAGVLPKEHKDVLSCWNLLRQVDIRLETVKMVEESSPYFMPPSNLDEGALFDLLINVVAEKAINKEKITPDILQEELQKKDAKIFAKKTDESNQEVNELLELFTKHAAFMEEDPTGGDPTVMFDAIRRTRSNMGEKPKIMLGKGPLAERFQDIQKQLHALERDFWDEYPEAADLADETTITTLPKSERKKVVRAKLGEKESDQASEFLRRRALQLRKLVEELVADLDHIQKSS